MIETVIGFVIALVAFVVVMVITALGGAKKSEKNKGDYIARKETDATRGTKTENGGDVFPDGRYNKTAVNAEKTSAVHANCDHAKVPTPYIDVNDTYQMTWDDFKSFALKLLSAEYPTAVISPYKYRGSPDIQLKTGGKDVDVRLIFVRENVVVDKNDFNAALRDVDDKDDVADWIITNGRFSLAQKNAAGAKRVALSDAGDLFAMMRRCNISAKKGE